MVACENTFYVLKYNLEAVTAHFAANGSTTDGVEDAFEVLHEIPEKVMTAQWVGDSFIYTSGIGRLNHLVGKDVETVAHLERPMFLLGYIPKENRLYLIDKENSIVSFTLQLSVVEFQTAVLRGELEEAMADHLPDIPTDKHDKLARFLESQGHMEQALSLARDADHKFDLAVQLGNLDMAEDIATEAGEETKWQQLSELALGNHDLELAEECMRQSGDVSGLLLLGSCTGDADGLARYLKPDQHCLLSACTLKATVQSL